MEDTLDLMPRPTFPRSNDNHALAARKILNKHAALVGSPVTLPIPIELIIEQTYGLEILWEELPEPPGAIILGKLQPSYRRIVLNIRHEAMFEEWMGPERFTLAHELAHWVYDADNPEQLSFNLEEGPEEQYCYHNESPNLRALETLRIREMNANKLAAHLLLPEDLVLKEDMEVVLRDIPGTASKWRVSRTTLRIRMQELGLIKGSDVIQPDLI